MKIFVTGCNGQLGHDVVNACERRGIAAVGSDLAPSYSGIQDGTAVTRLPYVSLDITDASAVADTIRSVSPDVVVHCAAWTAVDAAEEEANAGKVMAINEEGTRNIAKACKENDAAMIYISTDYVFSGKGEEPWKPDDTRFSPLNTYGLSKLLGEMAVKAELDNYYIVRIAWVFGSNGSNFIRTMLNLGKKVDHLRIVNDQIGTPTYTLDLAELLVDMALEKRYGVYHATNEGGFISWYDFAAEIFRQAAAMGFSEYAPERLLVEPVSTAEYGLSKAARPFNSRLDKSKLSDNGFKRLPDWKDALHRYLETQLT